MKTSNLVKLCQVLGLAVALSCGSIAFADDVAVTTTTTAGTITEFSPETLVVRTESSADPIRYTYTKKTVYVDETGTPVSIETVKSGLPVTVYYVKDGDRMVANRVVVRKHVTEEPGKVIERKTTTTTTEEKDK